MEIKIKILSPLAKIPKYATNGDAGLDLTVTDLENADTNHIRYKFGIAVEIPKGHVGLMFPRSSIYKQGQLMSNAVGVIDSSYRVELMAVMLGNKREQMYKVGDRAAQIIILPYPEIEFIEAEELSETERGSGGYGSTN